MTSENMADKNYISDELLAAFLEGNVSEKEMAQVLHAMKHDSEIAETLDVAIKMENEEDLALQIAAEDSRNLCDVKCEAYVLREQGVYADENELLEVAKDNRWIRKVGTPLNCIGNLMKYKGLKVSRKNNASIEDVIRALKGGKGVIVAVDNDKLYPERPDEEDATNHAIVVVNVSADMVTIFDPEMEEMVDIRIDLFMSAWKESSCYMVSGIK